MSIQTLNTVFQKQQGLATLAQMGPEQKANWDREALSAWIELTKC